MGETFESVRMWKNQVYLARASAKAMVSFELAKLFVVSHPQYNNCEQDSKLHDEIKIEFERGRP
jgi:hypothetical protein